MNATAARILDELHRKNPNVTATAAALNTSKQAYSIARQRGSLSDELCLKACALLAIDPAVTLAEMHRDAATTPDAVAVWNKIAETISQRPKQRASSKKRAPVIQIMRLPRTAKRTHVLPSIKTTRIERAEVLTKWMLSIPCLSPLSPRFVYYADNWHVLDKIERAQTDGTLATLIENSPAFHANELRASLDYIDRSDAIISRTALQHYRPGQDHGRIALNHSSHPRLYSLDAVHANCDSTNNDNSASIGLSR